MKLTCFPEPQIPNYIRRYNKKVADCFKFMKLDISVYFSLLTTSFIFLIFIFFKIIFSFQVCHFFFLTTLLNIWASQVALLVKNPPTNAGDTRDGVSLPGLGRSTGVGNGNPLQYSCLENSMDRGSWWATVHGATKSLTQLSTHTIGDLIYNQSSIPLSSSHYK